MGAYHGMTLGSLSVSGNIGMRLEEIFHQVM